MRAHRPAAASALLLVAAILTACAAPLPASVVPGSRVVVGWSGELTSLNALAAPTAGNLDIAAATRGGFGVVTDGDFVADPSFGTVSLVGDDGATVRYDLAEPAWSDGIPVDAADLLLDWAFGAGLLGAGGGSDIGDAAASPTTAVPTVDEFARAIEVTFPVPTILWQSAVTAQVPAHVVGARAFGLDDPMQAKQAVIRAIEDDDHAALTKIADAWWHGFDVDDGGDVADGALISSGPYRVEQISADASGQSVTLVPNAAYRGAASPQVARIEVVPAGADAVSEIGDRLDIATVAPTAANRVPIQELERRDATVQTTDDGSVWSVLLNPLGVFIAQPARAAFLRALPVGDMVDAGAGEWASAYVKTTSMVAAPGSPSYGVVAEDSGFTTLLGTPADDAALDRTAAGVAVGAPVCVLYDRASAFASGMFAALRDAGTQAGWGVTDCGSDDLDAAIAGGAWDALIAPEPVPQTPAQLAVQWGSSGGAALRRAPDAERDVLIAQWATTVDVYDARELLAQIEATIMREAVARPIAMNPRITLADRRVTGVTARNGAPAPLLTGVAQWVAASASNSP